MHTSIRALLLAMATTLVACANYSMVSPDGTNTGGTSSTSPTNTGSGAASTTSGTGGSASQGLRLNAADFVAAGNRSGDGARTAVLSLGEAPGSNGVLRSQKYKLIGGVVATTQP